MSPLSSRDPATKKNILFVDDEQALLDGLRGVMRPYRRQWTMRFVTNGQEALAAIDAQPPDVIVADLRMPGIDGATLLQRARVICPGAIRIVLSGHAEIGLVARAAAVAHRLFAKPCEATELAETIDHLCALQQFTDRIELAHHATGTSTLPSIPRLYDALGAVVQSGTAGAADAARVIQQDTAISAKVLQLANSGYFGRSSPVTSVPTAVSYLGLDVLRALVLQTETFEAFRVNPTLDGFDPEHLQQHSLHVARLARQAANRESQDDAFAAGLLHDVGLLVLAAESPRDLVAILAASRERNGYIAHVEIEQLGATHAEIGAYLLGLWGLPPSITEAVARHQTARQHDLPWESISTVYVANALVEELYGHDPYRRQSPTWATTRSLPHGRTAAAVASGRRGRQRLVPRARVHARRCVRTSWASNISRIAEIVVAPTVRLRHDRWRIYHRRASGRP